MIVMLFVAIGVLLAGCSAPNRKNPNDPRGGSDGTNDNIQLVAHLPEGGTGRVSDVLWEIRYEVSGAGLKPIAGPMNLVGRSARAGVVGVPLGAGRLFKVTALDPTEVVTFTAEDTILVGLDTPEVVELQLTRLNGSLELTSDLPPEVVELEVGIDSRGDTLLRYFPVTGPLTERINGIPTGGDVVVALRAYDADGQILLQQQLKTDIRDDLVARISLEVVGGFLEIIAHFPEYTPVVEIDRFSDDVATFFRRSDNPDLPAINEPIDFDQPRFRSMAFGPNGETVWFYNFDTRPKEPAIVYFLVDRRDNPIDGQLPIFANIPGDEGYSDFCHIHHVRVIDSDYRANALHDVQAVLYTEWEVIPTEQVMQAVMVPDGSKAKLRFDPAIPSELLDGWYDGKIVKYMLFEHPASIATVDFSSGEINTPQMYAFFANNRDEKDGFELNVETGSTHNVVTRLPGEEGYSPLWVLQVFTLAAFDRLQDLASALDQSKNEENKLDLGQLLYFNAPIVRVGELDVEDDD